MTRILWLFLLLISLPLQNAWAQRESLPFPSAQSDKDQLQKWGSRHFYQYGSLLTPIRGTSGRLQRELRKLEQAFAATAGNKLQEKGILWFIQIYSSPHANAFVEYHSDINQVEVGVTSGLLRSLSPRQLAFVFAHESVHLLRGHINLDPTPAPEKNDPEYTYRNNHSDWASQQKDEAIADWGALDHH